MQSCRASEQEPETCTENDGPDPCQTFSLEGSPVLHTASNYLSSSLWLWRVQRKATRLGGEGEGGGSRFLPPFFLHACFHCSTELGKQSGWEFLCHVVNLDRLPLSTCCRSAAFCPSSSSSCLLMDKQEGGEDGTGSGSCSRRPSARCAAARTDVSTTARGATPPLCTAAAAAKGERA